MGLLTDNNKSIEVRMCDLIAGDISVSSTSISLNLFDGLRRSSPNEYMETRGRMTRAQWKNDIDDLEGILRNTMKEGFKAALAALEDSLDESVRNSVLGKLIRFLDGGEYRGEENDIFINSDDPVYTNWSQIRLGRVYSDKLSEYFNAYMLENFEKNVIEQNLELIYRVSNLNCVSNWGVNDNNFITISRRTFESQQVKTAMLWPVVVEMSMIYGKVYYNLFNINGMVSIDNLIQ